MNKLNKELLDRALVEGVDESHDGNVLSLGVGNRLWNGFHITAPMGQFNRWQYVCTKEQYLAAKAEKESRKTVMDAVNYFKGSWPYAWCDFMCVTSANNDSYASPTFKGAERGYLNGYHTLVCTRKEFNAIVTNYETNFGTSLPYDEYKKGYKLMQDTVSEYDIGCYYEFSDDEYYEDLFIGVLASVGRYKANEYPFECKGAESYRYIRPLTIKAGEIRKPKPLRGFVNVYSVYNIESTIFKTRDLANLDQYVSARVACIDLSQFNEGEGL